MSTIPVMEERTAADWIRNQPFAHRGLHDAAKSVFENTLPAITAATSNGFGIEVDLQISKDGVPYVFHDYDLKRMTGSAGQFRDLTAREVDQIRIMGTDIIVPSLRQMLEVVQGNVPILLELKGLPGKDTGFVKSVSSLLQGYDGKIAIMSFSHHILADAREYAPHLTLGLTAEGGENAKQSHETAVQSYYPDFLSYELENLDTTFVREFTQGGKPSVSWTVRSKEDAAFSDRFVDQITFEGFLP